MPEQPYSPWYYLLYCATQSLKVKSNPQKTLSLGALYLRHLVLSTRQFLILLLTSFWFWWSDWQILCVIVEPLSTWWPWDAPVGTTFAHRCTSRWLLHLNQSKAGWGATSAWSSHQMIWGPRLHYSFEALQCAFKRCGCQCVLIGEQRWSIEIHNNSSKITRLAEELSQIVGSWLKLG